MLLASLNIGPPIHPQGWTKIRFFGGTAMKRFAAIGLVAITGTLTLPVAAQQKAAVLEIHALSTHPELVSGGDVLLQVAGPANLTAKNLTVRVNGKDVSTDFKPAAGGKAL